MNLLRVWMRKEEIDPAKLAGGVAVVIDVLLATTTMLTALDAGARRVIPAGSPEAVRQLRRQLGRGKYLIAGEDQGLPVDGFDCGPFPDEFGADSVQGRDVVFLSTNGTRAVHAARSAEVLTVACLRNVPAVARFLDTVDAPVTLICSGSAGRVSWEDSLCAAAILARLNRTERPLNDAAVLLKDWGSRLTDQWLEHLMKGRVGRWFMEHGRKETLRFAARYGASETVPLLQDGSLTAPQTPIF